MKKSWSLKGWLLQVFLLAGLFSANVNGANNLWLITFDIGHANSELFVFPDGKKMLFDAGTEEKCVSKIIPFLKYHEITQLDYVIRSHEHPDHVGGIKPLQIAGIINSKTLIQDCKSFKIGDKFVRSGTNWYIYNASYGGMDNPNSVSFFMFYNGFRVSGSGDEKNDGKITFMKNTSINFNDYFPVHVRVYNEHATGAMLPEFDGKLNAYIWIFPTYEGNPNVQQRHIDVAKNSPRFKKIVYMDKIHVIRASSGTDWESFYLDKISSKGKFIVTTPTVSPDRSEGEMLPLALHGNDITLTSHGAVQKIRFSVTKTAHITLALYDSQGKLLTRIFNGFLSCGSHTVELGTSSYKTGVYYVEGFAGRNRIIKKLALVR